MIYIILYICGVHLGVKMDLPSTDPLQFSFNPMLNFYKVINFKNFNIFQITMCQMRKLYNY